MNKKNRGSLLVTSVVIVLILSTISVLVMGLVMAGIGIQHRNEEAAVAQINLENVGYYCLNDYGSLNKELNVTYPVIGHDGYTYSFLAANRMLVTDNRYQLEITFSVNNPYYQIEGWVIRPND